MYAMQRANGYTKNNNSSSNNNNNLILYKRRKINVAHMCIYVNEKECNCVSVCGYV